MLSTGSLSCRLPGDGPGGGSPGPSWVASASPALGGIGPRVSPVLEGFGPLESPVLGNTRPWLSPGGDWAPRHPELGELDHGVPPVLVGGNWGLGLPCTGGHWDAGLPCSGRGLGPRTRCTGGTGPRVSPVPPRHVCLGAGPGSPSPAPRGPAPPAGCLR